MPRYRYFILGGPLASLLLLLLLAVSLPWKQAIFGEQAGATLTGIAGRFVVFAIMLSAVNFVLATCIPFRFRGIYNDAAQLLLPLVNKRQAEARILGLKWSAEVSAGMRCADWDCDTLRKLLELASAPFERAIYAVNLGNGLIYSGHVEEGLAFHEESYLSLAKPTGLLADFECVIALDVAFGRAYFAKDLEGAKEALLKAETIGSSRKYGFYRAKAAISLLERDFEAVQENAKEGKAWLDLHENREKPIIEAAYEEMDKLIAEAEVGKATL